MGTDVNQDWRKRAQTPADVLAHVRSGHRIFVHGAAATPTPLLDALVARQDLEQVQLYHLHLSGGVSIADVGRGQGVFSNSLFAGPGQREALISIAHPDFRSELRQHANALRHFTLT